MGIKDMSEGVGKLAVAYNEAGLSAKLFGTTARTALVATGIGAFVVALGLVVAYWDDITEAVGGASRETKDILTVQENLVTESQAQLDLLNSQDNVLKLQGLSETQILNLKIAQTDEVIAQLELQKKAAKEVADEQIKNTSRVVGFLQANPMLQGIGSLFGYGYEDLGDIAKEGQDVQNEIDKQINNLANQRAGYQIAINKTDDAAAQKVKDRRNKEKEDAERAEKDRLKSLEDIRKDYVKRTEDDAAESELQKVQLEEQRALEELTRLKATEEQKLQITNYYKELKRIAEEEDDLKAKEKAQKDKDDAYNLAMDGIQMEYDMAQEKIYVRSMIVDAISQLAGEETAIGKAAFIAQQALRIQDLMATAQAALEKIAIEQAGVGADIGKGLAATIKAGFPQNVPYLIAYAAQAAAIVATTVKAFSKAKSTVSKVGGVSAGNSSAPSIQAPGTPGGANNNLAIEAPQFQPEERAIRTYVLSGDVTSSQEADAKLNRRRSVG
tara:strand:- start:667 stop:2163 length:1497 start_codon:yes stop_codon:yes gene_type:complete